MAREIEIEDPEPPPQPGAPAAESPYKNLLVPLVVVPFLVVAVLVLVFVFFGAITGAEATLDQNLDRVVHGGSNESQQAAMNLSSQAAENARARQEGKPEPWPAGPDFRERLAKAWTEIDEDDREIRLTIAQLCALHGDPEAGEKLALFLRLDDAEDPDGQLRFAALMALSWFSEPGSAELVIPFLRHSDPLLRQTAAGVLQKMPGGATVAALRSLLDDPSLELRGQAAISLSHLGSDAGAEVLVELVERESYAAAHRDHPKKYASPQIVRESRCKALQALARLSRPADRALFERVAASEEDPLVRETALRALEPR